ncbi:MAG TPA: HAD-IIIA family hydrolase [Candidatus Thermoplasmatota archaeon]|nr:HAD-IIIA family hydrolase [Candidatus Thermoplasmatota archaeon]
MRPAVFLDRDGVLNARRLPLVRKPSQLRILPGVAEAVSRLTRAGFAVCVATNQEFVDQPWFGSTYIRREDHDEVMRLVVEAMESEGGAVDGVYACLHRRGSNCEDQKPKPGLLRQAARELELDLKASFMVGDNTKDMLAGRRAGCRTVLVDPRLRTRLQRADRYATHVARDLPAAVDWILRQKPVVPRVALRPLA